jgi:hypothetical protein
MNASLRIIHISCMLRQNELGEASFIENKAKIDKPRSFSTFDW